MHIIHRLRPHIPSLWDKKKYFYKKKKEKKKCRVIL